MLALYNSEVVLILMLALCNSEVVLILMLALYNSEVVLILMLALYNSEVVLIVMFYNHYGNFGKFTLKGGEEKNVHIWPAHYSAARTPSYFIHGYTYIHMYVGRYLCM